MTTHINLYKCVTKCIKSSGEHKGVLRARLLKNGYTTVPISLFLNLRLNCTNNKPRLQKIVKNKKISKKSEFFLTSISELSPSFSLIFTFPKCKTPAKIWKMVIISLSFKPGKKK